MKKSLLFFVLLVTGTLTLSATIQEDILGKWFVKSLEMAGTVEEFEDETSSPWMEFKEENVLVLGEADREPEQSEWFYDEDSKSIYIESFGTEVPFDISELTKSKLTLMAKRPDGQIMTIVLIRSF